MHIDYTPLTERISLPVEHIICTIGKQQKKVTSYTFSPTSNVINVLNKLAGIVMCNFLNITFNLSRTEAQKHEFNNQD